MRTVLRATPVGMAAIVVVDAVLGERAEYFDAASLLRSWSSVLSGHGPGDQVFLLGQERIGSGPALVVGAAVLVVEGALVAAAAGLGWTALAHRARRRSHGARDGHEGDD